MAATATAAAPLEDRVRLLLAGDSSALVDPYPTWNELRETHPVWRFDGTVILSRHADVKELLGDNNVFYSRAATRHAPHYEAARTCFSPAGRAAFDEVLEQEFQQLVRLDPPDHPRVKQLMQAPFSIRSLKNEMEEKIRMRVHGGLDELASEGGVVDYKRFAYALPMMVLGDLLGIPLTDLDRIHAWANRIAENKFNADSESASIEAAEAYRGLLDYIEELLTATGVSPTGLVAALLQAESSGSMTHDECKAMAALMIFAGHETTSNLLSIGMLGLLNHRDQWDVLVAEPDLAPAAVEELVRWVTPAHFLPYRAAQRRELHGVVIEEGDAIIGVIAAANRDPLVFAEPDTLDLRRRDARAHVGFGMGPHSCLGAGLARMEASILFRSMAERFPRAHLADGAEVRWGGRSLRSPIELPLVLEP